jgi:type VI secretion system protein ImpA
MSSIEIEKLLAPVSPDKLSGDNLEDDTAYAELVRAAQGKPEKRMGDATIPGEEPNWKDVKARAIQLLGRSKDLRTAVRLTQALLRTDGFDGMADGLALVKGLAERYWDSVHPQLDPEDGNDPVFRINTLLDLGNAEIVLRGLREMTLASSRAHGRVTLRDVLIATGRLPRPAGDTRTLEMTTIDAAFRDCDPDQLTRTAAGVVRITAELGGIESTLNDKAGTGSLTGLTELSGLLKTTGKILQARLAARGLAAAAEGDMTEEADATTTGAAANASGTSTRAMSLDGEVTSRDQAIQLLDRVSEFFVRTEPSSPVPLLLRRARRLISKTFLDIVRDIAPDALAQVEKIRGDESSE